MYVSKDGFVYHGKSEIEELAPAIARALKDQDGHLKEIGKSGVSASHPFRVFIRRVCDYQRDVHLDQWTPALKLIKALKLHLKLDWMGKEIAASRPRYRGGFTVAQIQMLRAYEYALIFRRELDRLGLPVAWTGEEPVLNPYIQSLIDKRAAGEKAKKRKDRATDKSDADAAAKLPAMSPSMERLKIAQLERRTNVALARAASAEENAKTISDEVKDKRIAELEAKLADRDMEIQELREDNSMWREKYGELRRRDIARNTRLDYQQSRERIEESLRKLREEPEEMMQLITVNGVDHVIYGDVDAHEEISRLEALGTCRGRRQPYLVMERDHEERIADYAHVPAVRPGRSPEAGPADADAAQAVPAHA